MKDKTVTRCRRSKNSAPTWINANDVERFREDLNEYTGFVYKITERDTGMVYFGIKKFWKRIRRKPLKGKKRVRIDYVESDWKTYKTSSPIMQKKLEENPDNYRCTIMKFCKSVTDMKATEAYYQLTYYSNGGWDSVYNEVINLRLRIPKSK